MPKTLQADDTVGEAVAPAPRRRSPIDTLLAANGGLVQHIPLTLLEPHPDNPREDLGDLTGLIASMNSPTGLLQPLTVVTAAAFWAARGVHDTVDAGRYVVLAGHRRRAALEKAGHTDAPCLVRDDLAGDDAVVAMLIENLHRSDLAPLEEARGFTQLRTLGLTQTQIAAKVGCTQSNVSKKLALLKLPEEVQAQVAAGHVPVADAVELAHFAEQPDVVAEAVVQRAPYETVAEAAERIVENRALVAKLDAAREQLRGQGVKRFVTSRPVSYRLEDYLSYGRGPLSLDALSRSGVDVTDHDALACHAVSVTADLRDQVVTAPVCTKPRNHAGALTAKRDRAAERARREAEKAAVQADARRELTRAMLAGKPGKELSELVDTLVITGLAQGLNREAEISVLADLLGVEVRGPGIDMLVTRGQILAAATTAAERARLIAALALARCELDVDRDFGDHRNAGTYLRFLQSNGHTLAGVERRHVGRGT